MNQLHKAVLLVVVGLVVLSGVGWYVLHEPETQVVATPSPEEPTMGEPVATTSVSVIGQSIKGRPIEAHTFGTGPTNLLFVGGIHGGYEWNSILLAYEAINYLATVGVSDQMTVHIIPNLNPDGLYEATGLEGRFTSDQIPDRDIHTAGIGRFNANNVDLNRNFACKWTPESSWRGQPVSAGTAAFSEPEAMALRDYVRKTAPEAAVFWHSRANNVYGSECENGILPETLTLMETYARAAGYGEVPIFDAYPVTGDAEGWLTSLGIPAVTVELETRDSSEWNRNKAGIEAVLEMYTY